MKISSRKKELAPESGYGFSRALEFKDGYGLCINSWVI